MRMFTEFMGSPRPIVPEGTWWDWRGSVNGVGYYRWIPRGKRNTLRSIVLPRHIDVVRAAHSKHALEYFGEEAVRSFLDSTVYRNSKGFFVNTTSTKKNAGVPLTGMDVIDSWLRKPEIWDDVFKMHSPPVDGKPYILHQYNASLVVAGHYSIVSGLLFDVPGVPVSHMTLSLVSTNTVMTLMEGTVRMSGASYAEYSHFFHSRSVTGESQFYIIPTRVAERRIVFAEAGVETDYALLWASITADTEDDDEALGLVRRLGKVPMGDVLRMMRLGVGFDTIATTWGKGIDDDLLVSLSAGAA